MCRVRYTRRKKIYFGSRTVVGGFRRTTRNPTDNSPRKNDSPRNVRKAIKNHYILRATLFFTLISVRTESCAGFRVLSSGSRPALIWITVEKMAMPRSSGSSGEPVYTCVGIHTHLLLESRQTRAYVLYLFASYVFFVMFTFSQYSFSPMQRIRFPMGETHFFSNTSAAQTKNVILLCKATVVLNRNRLVLVGGRFGKTIFSLFFLL